MKELEVYTKKVPVKIFGDMVNIYYRIFPIQELDKHIQELEIDDYHKQVILSAYEQNKQDNPNDIAIYRNQFNNDVDENLYFSATSNQQAIEEFFTRLNQFIVESKSNINSVKVKDNLYYIAQNPNLTLEQFDILFKIQKSDVLSSLAKNLSISENLAFELIKMEERKIMRNVFRNPSINDDFIIKMLNDFPDKNGYALFEISDLPTLSNKVKEAFIKKLEASHNYLEEDNFYEVAIRQFLDRNDLSDHDVDLLLQSEHKQIKEMLAESQCLSKNTINKLISLNDPFIYMHLARNQCVSVEKIMTFIDKLDKFDQANVIRCTPHKELHQHYFEVDDIEIKSALASSLNIDVALLEKLADSNDDEVIMALTTRYFLPIEIVKKLSLKEANKHKKYLVRHYLHNPELKEFWKNHPDNEVREYYTQLFGGKRRKR
jgi:hypothetical protein